MQAHFVGLGSDVIRLFPRQSFPFLIARRRWELHFVQGHWRAASTLPRTVPVDPTDGAAASVCANSRDDDATRGRLR
jgi:hypothetical protein